MDRVFEKGSVLGAVSTSDDLARAAQYATRFLDQSFGIGREQAHEILRRNSEAKRIYDCAHRALAQTQLEIILLTRLLRESSRETTDNPSVTPI